MWALESSTLLYIMTAARLQDQQLPSSHENSHMGVGMVVKNSTEEYNFYTLTSGMTARQLLCVI